MISYEEWRTITGRKPIDPAMYSTMAKQLDYKTTAQLPELISKELERIKEYDMQYSLNRENIWIVKPASRSRGRGIKAFSDLDEILDYVVGRDDIQWVAQKYIENPLIVKNRKVHHRIIPVRHSAVGRTQRFKTTSNLDVSGMLYSVLR